MGGGESYKKKLVVSFASAARVCGLLAVLDTSVVPTFCVLQGHYLHKLGDRDARDVNITQIMTSRFESLRPDNTVRDCLRLLSEKR